MALSRWSHNIKEFIMIKSILFLLCFAPVMLFAKDIEGVYNISGYDPHSQGKYQGIAEIKLKDAKNEIYEIICQLNHPVVSTYATGVKIDNTLSCVFAEMDDTNNTKYGLQTYVIHNDKLSGPWIFYGDTVKGMETLTKTYQ